MLDIQLGRRNLSPIQRIAVAEKYRPIYEKKAKENQGARNDLKNNIPQNLGESEKLYGENHPKDKSLSPNGEKVITSTRTDKELAKLAGVGTGTVTG